jgi:hypothetical protein
MTKQGPNGALHGQTNNQDTKNIITTLPLDQTPLQQALQGLKITRSTTNTKAARFADIAETFVAYTQWQTDRSNKVPIKSDEEFDAYQVKYDKLFDFVAEHVGVWEMIMKELDGDRNSAMSTAVHLRCLEHFIERVGLEGKGLSHERLEWEGKMRELKEVFLEIHKRGEAVESEE